MNDVVQSSAVAHRDTAPSTRPHMVESPAVSGKMLAREVQPGLFATGLDLAYREDARHSQSVSASIVCGVQLSEQSQPLDVEGHGRVSFRQGKPFLLGFGDRSHCESCYHAGARCSFAGFVLQPAFFDRFSDSVSDEGVRSLQRLIEGGVSVRSFSYCPNLIELAHQTLHHHYDGALADLFLEGCVLSLVAEIGKLVSAKGEHAQDRALSGKQYERVRYTREVLDRAIATPPRMRDLAQQIGINATTLQTEFRLAYGVTVFGYVREQRLQLARALLRTQDLAVSQIAYRVGFSNAAAFATAYRRRFGHPPSIEKTAS